MKYKEVGEKILLNKHRCCDYDEDCYDVKDKIYCYNICPEEGYCPFLRENYIEKLEKELFLV